MGTPFGEKKNRAPNQERIVTFEKTQRVCARAKKEEVAQEKRERADKSELLREKKTAKRELCVEKKIERRVQSVAAFERDNLCVRE